MSGILGVCLLSVWYLIGNSWLATADSQRSTFTNNMAACRTADRRTGTEEHWGLMNSKPMSHVPSTYQEGYQAGYDHVGIPDSPEVLKGYIEGLIQFLSDENRKGQNGALRGLVVSSAPHDSAVSMSFNPTNAPAVARGQENVRSARNFSANILRNPAYGIQDTTIPYTLSNDVVDPRMRNSPTSMCLSVSNGKDKTTAHKQTALAAAEKDGDLVMQDKGTVSRADTMLNGGGHPRQFSESQLNSHAYGAPVSLQRLHPSPEKLVANGQGTNIALSNRSIANHRMSGLDGAMDDLADIVLDTPIDDWRSPAEGRPFLPVTTGDRGNDDDVSCFRPTSSKAEQRAASPNKSAMVQHGDGTASSPANTPDSPRKSGEHSPAKAKLEQVTNKFRRLKKDDLHGISPEEKNKRVQKWHRRFQRLKETERKEIENYMESQARNQ